MRYAIQNPDGMFTIDFLWNLFPDTSFSVSGPSDAWLDANAVFAVVDSMPVDSLSMLASAPPYLLNGRVYTVRVEARPLGDVQARQKALVDSDYAAAVQEDVIYTTEEGTTAAFQADDDSQKRIMQSSQGYDFSGATPSGFVWKATDNTLIPFNLGDLKGLYLKILSRGWDCFQKRDALKAAIDEATEPSEVLKLTWDEAS